MWSEKAPGCSECACARYRHAPVSGRALCAGALRGANSHAAAGAGRHAPALLFLVPSRAARPGPHLRCQFRAVPQQRCVHAAPAPRTRGKGGRERGQRGGRWEIAVRGGCGSAAGRRLSEGRAGWGGAGQASRRARGRSAGGAAVPSGRAARCRVSGALWCFAAGKMASRRITRETFDAAVQDKVKRYRAERGGAAREAMRRFKGNGRRGGELRCCAAKNRRLLGLAARRGRRCFKTEGKYRVKNEFHTKEIVCEPGCWAGPLQPRRLCVVFVVKAVVNGRETRPSVF